VSPHFLTTFRPHGGICRPVLSIAEIACTVRTVRRRFRCGETECGVCPVFLSKYLFDRIVVEVGDAKRSTMVWRLLGAAVAYATSVALATLIGFKST